LNWISLAANLPADGPIHVLREDPVNPDLLYVGTEFGLLISLDAGRNWHKQKHLPTVPVHDLVIHPRDRELVIGTHGRAIWIMDVLPLQELTAAAQADAARFCSIRSATAFRRQVKQNLGIKNFVGENAPYGAGFYFHLRDKPAVAPTLTLLDAKGKKITELKGNASPGLQRMAWDLNRPGKDKGAFHPVPAGAYTAVLRIGKKEYKQHFQIEVDD
jgi:hypothetical protein